MPEAFSTTQPEDVRVVAIDERLAGLSDEGQGAQALHGFADRLVFVGGVPAVAGGRTEALGFVQGGDLRFRAVGDAGGVGEQVLDGDGTLGGNGGDAGSRPSPRRWSWLKVGMKWPTGSLRPILPSSTSARIAVLVMALVCEAMRKMVLVVIAAGLFVAPADGALVDRAPIAQDECDGAGDLVVIHVLLQEAVQARQPLRR